MTLKRTVAPSGDVVSLSDAKAHLRVDHSDDDDLISSLASAAAGAVEEMAGRPLLTQTWKLTLAEGSGRIRLPKTPVQSVTEIAYYDRDNASQTATLSDFHVISDNDMGFIEPKQSASWPETYSRPDALSITWTAGYGAAADVPADLVHAIKMMLGHLYEHREAVVVGQTVTDVPLAVEHLVGLHRRGWVA